MNIRSMVFLRHSNDDLSLGAFAAVSGLVLYGVSTRSYLLFHTLVELLAVAVAWALFLLSWNTRKQMKENSILLLGVGYLFVGLTDMLHTLAYEGLAVIPGGGVNLATQYWMGARWIETAALLGYIALGRRKLKPELLLPAFLVLFLLFFLGIQVFSYFPDCFIPGSSLTPFKIIGEYIIIAFLFAGTLTLVRHWREGNLPKRVMLYLFHSLVATMLSELAFTLYGSPFGAFNMIGHLLKFLSFLFIYKAILEEGLSRPLSVLFESIGSRDRILGGIARVSEKLIEESGGAETVGRALAILGEAARADRIYLFRNHYSPEGDLLTSQYREWSAPGIPSFAADPLLQDISYHATGFQRWEEELSRGLPITGAVDTFPEEENQFLRQQGILSIAIVPVFVRQRWWGFLGLDDCRNRRRWDTVEVETLKTAGTIIASWIDREQMEQDLIGSIERERNRFGRELHDNICQELKSLEIQAALESRGGSRNPTMEQRLNRVLQDAYRIARGLLPDRMEKEDFLQALKELAEPGEEKLPCTLEVDPGAIPPEAECRYHLYAICREGVLNARLHGGSPSIHVMLTRTETGPELVVEDRGCGFNREMKGMGIRIMEARASALGARLEIESVPEKGSLVRCRSLSRQWRCSL